MHPRTQARIGAALHIGWILILFTCPRTGGDDSGMTLLDVARLQQVGSVEVSPNGRLIAYVKSVPREPWKKSDRDEKVKDGSAWSELHVVDMKGDSRPFVTGKVSVGSAAWSPNGDRISFLAKRGEDKHKYLYVIPIDGGEARSVVRHDTDITDYSWSPDGNRVAFLAKAKPDKKRKKQKDKGFKQEVYEEDWRPVLVWIVDTADSSAKPESLELPGSASSVHWSPVGSRIAVALAPTPLIDDGYMKRKIHIVDTDSEEIVSRLDTGGKLGQIAWSPDGKHLAVIAGTDAHDPSPGHLFTVPASGGPLRDLLPDYAGQINSIAWQDSETIMYLGDRGVSTELAKIGRDGTGKKRILAAGSHVMNQLTVSRDGQSAALRSHAPTHPREVFTMKHGDAEPRRLTDSNPWLNDIRLAKQEVVTYRARDGLELQGLLVRPLDEEPGKRYPLVLIVHGGPESHYSHGWLNRYSTPAQVLAGRGFACFYPNYRGSTGRGVAFSKKGQSDYAGKEFDDLIDAIDHLVDAGLVDRDRVGVTGGSYGGFASAWCATYHTERFAASVMFVGISDQVSKFGTTDIPNEMYQVHSRRWPWEDWDWFRERSPIYHVQKARTPILIMHGKNDPRVHPSQSMELYRYLKTLGKTPVRLVLYPGEQHGNRKAAAQYDYSL
ncbi:MAG: S9 family peptidase, partial [Planctomycetota bacterium]|nr:S9 family peptidase [Planctomycetota bacterium]